MDAEMSWLPTESVLSIIWLILPTMLWKNLASQCMPMIWILLQGREIVVRCAEKDEKFVTLDGQETYHG